MGITGRPGNRIELKGEWDIARKDELKSLFDSIQRDGPVTIDLRQVTFADSSFLGLLGSLAGRLQGIPITLSGAQPNLRRVLTIVQFDRLFKIEDDG